VTKNTKSEFRAAKPDTVRIPKTINDKSQWAFEITQEDIKGVLSAASSMGQCEKLILTSKADGEIYFEFNDEITNDNLSIKVADSASWIPEDIAEPKQIFVHYYIAKSIIPLLKSVNGSAVLMVGEKGILQLVIDDISFSIIPRMN
jgi:hypothetical protein